MLVKLKAKMPSDDNDNSNQLYLVKDYSSRQLSQELFHRIKNIYLIL